MGVLGISKDKGGVWLQAVLAVLFVCAAFMVVVDASPGDRDPRYFRCLWSCKEDCKSGRNPPLASYLRALAWTCDENCQYECMHDNYELRMRSGESIVQYHGSWPFLRIWGIEEFASTLFSVVNSIPHFMYLYRYKDVPDSYPFKGWWAVYALVTINAWVWSTLYHARHIDFLEKMDYYCAIGHIFHAVGMAIIRVLNLHSLVAGCAVLLPMAVLFGLHVSYMQFVKFDYGFNMKVAGFCFVSWLVLWNIWYAVNRRKLPYAYKMSIVPIATILAASCEILDFPPILGTFDAHAIWHGLTPAISLLFYSFVFDDAQHEYRATVLSKEV
eukprot:GFYU01008284.1.p1 GENE.GFYU01008284.1~~GFYU01008284.1.p1  ORF type:complete len:328 (+),score=36.93 GFYU01008284.1:174-1157(+)